jgi:hypothetical protein
VAPKGLVKFFRVTQPRKLRNDWSLLQNLTFVITLTPFLILTFLISTFMPRPIYFDELVLLNVPYMISELGSLSYPMHGDPTSMVVHPPIHYLLIGFLAKLGLSPLLGAGIVTYLAFLIFILMLFFGRYSFNFTISLLISAYTIGWVWSETYFVRPDLSVTFIFLASALALDTGIRLRSSRFLFFGSALGTFLPLIHYWGVGGLILLPLALIYSWYEAKDSKVFKNVFKTLTTGCLSVALPASIVYLIPNARGIARYVLGVQARSTNAYDRHLESYRELSGRLNFRFSERFLGDLLVAIPLEFGIPAILLSLVLLKFFSELGFLRYALATLPLFVLLASRGKQIGYMGYLTLEFIIFAFLLILLAFKAVDRFQNTSFLVLKLFTILSLVLFSFVGQPRISLGQFPKNLSSQVNILDSSRAAGKWILGEMATVSLPTASGWYVSGADTSWNAFNELAETNKSLGTSGLIEKLKVADAVTLDSAYWNYSRDLVPLPDLYESGSLFLKGAIFPISPAESHLTQILLSHQTPEKVRLALIHQSTLDLFEADPKGDYIGSFLFCKNFVEVPTANHYFHHQLFFAGPPGIDEPTILTFINRDSSSISEAPAYVGCTLREEVRMNLRQVDRQRFTLDQLANDQSITFIQNSASLP